MSKLERARNSSHFQMRVDAILLFEGPWRFD